MKSNKGFTLIEVLVSLLILSIGALGLVGMQTRGLQLNQNSLHQSQVTMYVMDMVDRIRANDGEKLKYLIAYKESAEKEVSCTASDADCSPVTMAKYDLYQWRTQIQSTLPSGNSKIEKVKTAGGIEMFVVAVSYKDKRSSRDREFSMRVEI